MAHVNLNINVHVSQGFYDAIHAFNDAIEKYPNLANQSLSTMPSMQDLYEIQRSENLMVVMPSQKLISFLDVMGQHDQRVNLVNNRMGR